MILVVGISPSINRIYNLEKFNIGSTFVVDKINYLAGGGEINLAKTIKIFNQPIKFIGFLGGKSGEYIKSDLDSMGINHSCVDIKEESKSSTIILSEIGKRTEIIEEDPSISGEELIRFYEHYKKNIYDVDMIIASGKLPNSLPQDLYADLIIMAHDAGKKFFLDTSGNPLKFGVKSKPFSIIANREELGDILDFKIATEKEIVQAGKYLLENNIEIVIVTLGEDGSIAFYKGQIYRVRVPGAKALNHLGTGDAMLGGLVSSLYKGYDFELSLRIGAACGRAQAMNLGMGIFNMQKMKAIMNDIIISKFPF